MENSMRNSFVKFVPLRAVAVAMAVLGTGRLAAQDAKVSSISLGELSVVQVLTASKSLESASDAPGIVTTITAADIRTYGASNLIELLERLPGTYGLTNTNFPAGLVTVRGIEMSEVSNRVLVLLNGRPVRESTHGAMNMAFYTGLPLESIDRIEMVRGPGSVLYSTNAFAGVINVITKEPENAAVTTSAGYGSFDAQTLNAHAGMKHSGLSISASVKHARNADSRAAGESFKLGEDVTGGTLVARYRGLTFSSFGGTSTLARYDDGSPADMHTRLVAADLGYEQDVASWWKASLNATYNYTHNEWVANEKASDYVVEATNHLHLPGHTKLIFGGLAYNLTGSGSRGPFKHLPDYDETRWSGYAQVDIHATEQLKLIGGGQINKVEGVAADFVPRVGAIFTVTPSLGAKLLYGQAFRSPFAVERSINIPTIIMGNAALSPEKVGTLDAQLFYNATHVQLATTWFQSELRDLIVLAPNAARELHFLNQGRSSVHGIEVESRLKPTARVDFTGSVVYQMATAPNGDRLKTVIPSTLAKLGASYADPSGITIGVFNSAFNSPNFDFKPGVAVPESSSLTANVNLDLTKLMHMTRFPGVDLNVYGTNLLGQTIYSPQASTATAVFPRATGKAVSAALRMTL
jgi:outer membrane receptor for ferrienterochelin and colicins